LDHSDQLTYTIVPNDTELSKDWITALKGLLISNNHLEKNFCFLGFPNTARTLEYLCDELNQAVLQINMFNATEIWQSAGLDSFIIEDYYIPDVVRFGDEYPHIQEKVMTVPAIFFEKTLGYRVKHGVMNKLHNYFEVLQGTTWQSSKYYKLADYETKYAIRQLNILCHEIENLVLSQHKMKTMPEWVRPSQITTFLHAARYDLTQEHKQLAVKNGYDRRFGYVYMHWTQIGKTLYEVFRDEGAPDLTIGDDPTNITIGSGATCEVITALKYYSGEFDIEWGNDVYFGKHVFNDDQIERFYMWLEKQGIDRTNPDLCLGYFPIGQIDLLGSFGTDDPDSIREVLGKYLDIYSIEVDGVNGVFNYCWNDTDYKKQQIDIMRPGYDDSSRG
jgi:hypothetical protein